MANAVLTPTAVTPQWAPRDGPVAREWTTRRNDLAQRELR